MHAPYAAQYRVMGGSGAGSGGSFTPDASAVVSAVPLAPAADAAVAAVAVLAGVALAALGAEAPVAAVVVAAGALAPGAVAAAGMLAPGGMAEKVLGGKGGRDGAPVDDAWVAAGLRGGICDSRTMLTLLSLVAAAKQVALSMLR